MDVCCECCVLSGRGLCDQLIIRPEESYRLWCVVVCDLETSRMRRPWPALGRSATEKNYYYYFKYFFVPWFPKISTLQFRLFSGNLFIISMRFTKTWHAVSQSNVPIPVTVSDKDFSFSFHHRYLDWTLPFTGLILCWRDSQGDSESPDVCTEIPVATELSSAPA